MEMFIDKCYTNKVIFQITLNAKYETNHKLLLKSINFECDNKVEVTVFIQKRMCLS